MNRKIRYHSDSEVSPKSRWVFLAHNGENANANDDVPFVVDDVAFVLMRKQFRDRQIDVVVDYEHQSHDGSHPEGKAPAAGWIKDIKLTSVGLYGLVEWTSEALRYLQEKAYRYISPTFVINDKTRRVVALWSAGLTNTPAIHGMRPVAFKEKSMATKYVCAFTDTGKAVKFTAEGKPYADETASTLFDQVRDALGLGAEATITEVLAAMLEKLGSMSDDPPIEEEEEEEEDKEEVSENSAKIDALQQQVVVLAATIDRLTKRDDDAEFTSIISAARKAGKLSQGELHDDVMSSYRATYGIDGGKTLKTILSLKSDVVPQGGTAWDEPPVKTSRQSMIQSFAAKARGGGLKTGRLIAGFVNSQLLDAGESVLTAEENKAIIG